MATISDKAALFKEKETILKDLKGKKKTKMPPELKPMLATLVDEPTEEEGWLYEVKWDGFRTLAYLNSGEVEVRSRNNKPFNDKFYPIYNALKELPLNAVLDGEIVVLDDKGLADFGALQTWRSEADFSYPSKGRRKLRQWM